MKLYSGYIITPNPISPTLYQVATEGRGGKIPKVLEGNFTSIATVMEIIDHYQESKEVVNERKTAAKS